jgi:hypothetical protein
MNVKHKQSKAIPLISNRFKYREFLSSKQYIVLWTMNIRLKNIIYFMNKFFNISPKIVINLMNICLTILNVFYEH